MPLYRGSASKIILAHLPLRWLRRQYQQEREAIATAGLGEEWQIFRSHLRKLRHNEVCVTQGEIDPGRIGISAPVFGAEDEILGSIGLVVSADDVVGRENLLQQLMERVRSAGRHVSQALRD